jgi:retinol dehydrogenase 12
MLAGGNTGIGYHTVAALLSHNAKVYVFARNRTKAEAAIQRLEDETGKKAELVVGDLADIASIKRAAAELRR